MGSPEGLPNLPAPIGGLRSPDPGSEVLPSLPRVKGIEPSRRGRATPVPKPLPLPLIVIEPPSPMALTSREAPPRGAQSGPVLNGSIATLGTIETLKPRSPIGPPFAGCLPDDAASTAYVRSGLKRVRMAVRPVMPESPTFRVSYRTHDLRQSMPCRSSAVRSSLMRDQGIPAR